MSDRRRLFAQGLAWTAVAQVIEAAASFLAMLLLVRVIPPAEYGRAASATGILAFLNLWSGRAFIDYALQLPEGEEPEWSRLWAIGVYLQTALFFITHAVAFGLAYSAPLAPVAPLLHIAAFGLLIEAPAHLGATMIRRSLDIPRLRVLIALTVVVKLAGTVALALAGQGATAIVIGGSVLTAIPMTIDLLIVRGWRPAPSWWRAIDARRDREVLRFGTQRVASGLLGGGRSLLEGVILPATIGYEAVGLIGRAQALFSVTVGRLTGAVTDTAYPFVARASSDAPRFARWSGGMVFGLLLLAIPGAVFLAAHGTLVTTVLFGTRWLAVTPFIVPAVGAAMGAMFATTAATVLLAAGRLRDAFTLDVVAIVGALSAAVLTIAMPTMSAYVWILGAISLATGCGALAWLAHRNPLHPSLVSMASPIAAVSVAGVLASSLVARATSALPPLAQFVLISAAFGATGGVIAFAAFRDRIRIVESLVWSVLPQRWLSSATEPAAAAAVPDGLAAAATTALTAAESSPAKAI